MSPSSHGRFCWYELMTKNPEAAIDFYGAVVGWKTQRWEEAQYTMWVGAHGPLGGVMELPEQAVRMGAPPHWLSTVSVTDIESTLKQARALGCKVYVEPKEIPTVGLYAVMADAQGAPLALLQPAGDMTPHPPGPGEFVWSELATSDHKGAFALYQTLFGWEQTGSFDMGSMGEYLLFGRNGVAVGGMFTKPASIEMPPFWLYYTNVGDLDASISKATSQGAKVIHGPMEVPGGARVVQMIDPQGAIFCLHSGGA